MKTKKNSLRTATLKNPGDFSLDIAYITTGFNYTWLVVIQNNRVVKDAVFKRIQDAKLSFRYKYCEKCPGDGIPLWSRLSTRHRHHEKIYESVMAGIKRKPKMDLSLTAIKFIYNLDCISLGLLNVTRIAKILGLHRSHLAMNFKKETGIKLSDFILKTKVERAAALLQMNAFGIRDLSGILGFSRCDYFIRVFKKHYFVTPVFFAEDIKKYRGTR